MATITAPSASVSPSHSSTAGGAYSELCELLRPVGDAGAARTQLLNWDQETYMPAAAAPNRADQQSMMAALVHQRKTDPRIGELLATCEADSGLNKAGSETAANLREIRRDF